MKDPKQSTTWKLIGPLVWITIGVLFFLNWEWLALALAGLFMMVFLRINKV